MSQNKVILLSKKYSKKEYEKATQITNIYSQIGIDSKTKFRVYDYERINSGHTLVNGFLEACHVSFVDHQILEIKPDHIWLLICQGVSAHEEKTRFLGKLFDLPKEKKDIKIDVTGVTTKIDKDMFKNVGLPMFIDKIGETVPSDLFSLLHHKFSTTGVLETACSAITLMSSIKNYYRFIMRCGCAIPQIELAGKKEDWVSILDSAKLMREKFKSTNKKDDLSWWFDCIIPLIQEFVNVFNGKIDVKFWDSLYEWRSSYTYSSAFKVKCMRCSGWICAFFPYIKRGGEYQTNCYVKFDDFLNHNFNGDSCLLDPENLPRSLHQVEFIMEHADSGKKETLNFIAGFVGSKQNERGNIEPSLFWGVTEKLPKREENSWW